MKNYKIKIHNGKVPFSRWCIGYRCHYIGGYYDFDPRKLVRVTPLIEDYWQPFLVRDVTDNRKSIWEMYSGWKV